VCVGAPVAIRLLFWQHEQLLGAASAMMRRRWQRRGAAVAA
jgi:hypothetical protein